MTPPAAFEAWWKEQNRQFGLSQLYQESKAAWLAACMWQREEDANIVLRHQGSRRLVETASASENLGATAILNQWLTEIATAIRQGGRDV